MVKKIDGNKILVIYSNTNVKGKRDATGAFIPEARAFSARYDVPIENQFGVKCPNVSKAVRRRRVLDFLHQRVQEADGIECLALFCHGWPKGIQFGFNLQHIPQLVNAIIKRSEGELYIPIYACLTAEDEVRDNQKGEIGPATDGGFADLLRDELERNGIKKGWVDGHKTAGHTTWNPYVVRFLMDSVSELDEQGIGGSWLVGPRSQLWREWREALREGSFRYEFPFMTELEVKAKLAGFPW